jgi:hypothetical protein
VDRAARRGRRDRPLRREARLSRGEPTRAELAYGALVVAAFAAVALWRFDLVLQAGRVSMAVIARGGPGRWKLLGEIALFSAILLGTWKTIPAQPRPRHDAFVFLAAAAAGWAAEAWGTRHGLWSYYTSERPPLWIVPAWPLGAAFVERVGERLRQRRGSAPAGAYWALSAATLAVVAGFCAPRGAWAGVAVVAAALTLGARPERDAWTLAAGLGCVLFADFWGTTNGCWHYYLHGQPWGLWRGIGFGMTFDASVVLLALKAAGFLESRLAPASRG